jgi:AMME syndrome candidate gene 1 protein
MEMRIKATSTMCAACFSAIITAFNRSGLDRTISEFYQEEPLASQACPLFVTWSIGRERRLRGCIGTFDPDSIIGQTIPKYALKAAFKDSRFAPIDASELQQLSVKVSLLTNFHEIADPLDWEVGKHGIEIEFSADGEEFRGTYLPEVAEKQGWDQIMTLASLTKKAGFHSERTKEPREIVDRLRETLKVRTYESSTKVMNYAEYLDHKQAA